MRGGCADMSDLLAASLWRPPVAPRTRSALVGPASQTGCLFPRLCTLREHYDSSLVGANPAARNHSPTGAAPDLSGKQAGHRSDLSERPEHVARSPFSHLSTGGMSLPAFRFARSAGMQLRGLRADLQFFYLTVMDHVPSMLNIGKDVCVWGSFPAVSL